MTHTGFCSTLFINNNVDDKDSYTLCSKLVHYKSTFSTLVLLCDHSQHNHVWKTGSKPLAKFVHLLSLSSTLEHNDHNSCCSRLGGTLCWLRCTSSVSQSTRSMVQLGSIPVVGQNCPSLHRHRLLSKCSANVFPVCHVDLC